MPRLFLLGHILPGRSGLAAAVTRALALASQDPTTHEGKQARYEADRRAYAKRWNLPQGKAGRGGKHT